LLVAGPASRAGTALFFVACAAFAGWNGATSLLDPDYTTIFRLRKATGLAGEHTE